jgi:hypothetical protein
MKLIMWSLLCLVSLTSVVSAVETLRVDPQANPNPRRNEATRDPFLSPTSKEEYAQTVHAKLHAWRAKASQVETRALQAEAGERASLMKTSRTLRADIKVVEEDLKKMDAAGTHEWQTMEMQIRSHLVAMDQTYRTFAE